jgi:hypothetical protein
LGFRRRFRCQRDGSDQRLLGLSADAAKRLRE